MVFWASTVISSTFLVADLAAMADSAASVVRGGDAMESVHDDRPGKPLSERAKMALNAGLGFFDSSRYRTRPGPSPPMTAGVVGQTSPAVHRYADEEGDIDE